ncbi:hypothetical protein IB283_10050 [Escherichia coli]|uniref:hypothetical protein n=1 Tax=Escherichia coli TaxID=562 RepID=UPI0016622F6A|nr:hypothetical protein [Escherichia coli]QNR78296.1 hypothetical protein IB283_10050 [Escherichia coli]
MSSTTCPFNFSSRPACKYFCHKCLRQPLLPMQYGGKNQRVLQPNNIPVLVQSQRWRGLAPHWSDVHCRPAHCGLLYASDGKPVNPLAFPVNVAWHRQHNISRTVPGLTILTCVAASCRGVTQRSARSRRRSSTVGFTLPIRLSAPVKFITRYAGNEIFTVLITNAHQMNDC